MKILIFFLSELHLISRVDRKRKNELKIFAGDPRYRIEYERCRPVGLGATLGDGLKIKNNFSCFYVNYRTPNFKGRSKMKRKDWR